MLLLRLVSFPPLFFSLFIVKVGSVLVLLTAELFVSGCMGFLNILASGKVVLPVSFTGEGRLLCGGWLS